MFKRVIAPILALIVSGSMPATGNAERLLHLNIHTVGSCAAAMQRDGGDYDDFQVKPIAEGTRCRALLKASIVRLINTTSDFRYEKLAPVANARFAVRTYQSLTSPTYVSGRARTNKQGVAFITFRWKEISCSFTPIIDARDETRIAKKYGKIPEGDTLSVTNNAIESSFFQNETGKTPSACFSPV